MKNIFSNELPISLSIITPTYNGLSTLPVLFDSLCSQTILPDEWIVVDDESTDDIRSLCEFFDSRAPFPVIFIRIRKGHKKTAVNTGVKQSKSDFSCVIDDDDQLISNSISLFIESWNSLSTSTQSLVSGITFDCVQPDGSLIGTSTPVNGLITSELDLRMTSGFSGEKIFICKTKLMLMHLYPEFISGYVPETLMWTPIQFKNPSVFISHPFRIYDQTRQSFKKRIKGTHKIRTSRGRFYEICILIEYINANIYRPSLIYNIRLLINFWRFYFHCYCINDPVLRQCAMPLISSALIIFFLPGLCLFMIDRLSSMYEHHFALK